MTETMAQVVEIPALNRNPQFSPKEAGRKLESAFRRELARSENLTSGIREWTMQQFGNRNVTSPYNEQHLQHPRQSGPPH